MHDTEAHQDLCPALHALSHHHPTKLVMTNLVTNQFLVSLYQLFVWLHAYCMFCLGSARD